MNRPRLLAVAASAAVLALGPALTLPAIGAESASTAPVPVASDSSAPSAASAPSAPSAAVSAQLPRPTGPHAVGRTTLHLVDTDRPDPWVPSAGARQLMVSLYYPARSAGTGGPTAPYMTLEEARHLLELRAPDVTVPPEALSGVRTWAHTDARPAHGRFPLVVLSPGFTFPRATLTGLAEDLASRGYVVALVDHPYENAGTTLPDGQTLPCAICDEFPEVGPAVVESRAKDVSFVVDRLTGRHPAWRFARVIDAKRIGMAGHSIGGASAATAMAADPRVRAGVNMDGTFQTPIPASGLDGRPFLMLGQQERTLDKDWKQAWADLDGWKRWLTVAGADHGSFTDVPLLADLVGIPDTAPLPYLRSQALTRAYVAAFLDLHLKGVPQPLLDGPSPANPEVSVRLP
ncbi:alpha/beta hydrolase family protein [Streptomyces sp. CA-251387]|uniref:alpha/beta hydrolase family protein n=1 Tax=Streptomyces sp. CA-251387 TaxID=3240064 RepID=UPI003D921261